MNARADVPLVPVGAADWSEANQRWLAAELARLHAQVRARLEPDAELAPAAFEPTPWPQEAVAPPALERVARIFGLSRFERELLLLAAGIELDRGLRALLPAPLSFSLALSLLDAPHWDALSPLAPLRQ